MAINKPRRDFYSDNGNKSPFDDLSPDLILSAVESYGFEPTGEMIPLNSYENRVFEVRIEPPRPSHPAHSRQPIPKSVIAKFYRPGRWDRGAIQDEHRFLTELAENDIPAVCPYDFSGQIATVDEDNTVFQAGAFCTALFPKVQARMPDEFLAGDLYEIGKILGRLHNVGAQRTAASRPIMTAETYGDTALDRLANWVLPDLWPRYEEAGEVILDEVDRRLGKAPRIRIHGDCHKGNVLKFDPARTEGSVNAVPLDAKPSFFFVDFDDFCVGPEVQDFFMLLSSRLGQDEDASAEHELEEILRGYMQFRRKPPGLNAIEALRGLRIMHYSGWIAARWSDPAFRPLLPAFNSYEWWLDETQRLEEIADGLLQNVDSML